MTDPGARQNYWTQDDIVIAADIWQRHVTDVYGDERLPNGYPQKVFKRIAQAIGRKPYAVEARYRIYSGSFGLYRGNNKRNGLASAHAIAERDARQSARMRQDATGSLFGDPPPGFSVLDRMQGRR